MLKPETEDYFQLIAIAVANLPANEIMITLPGHRIEWWNVYKD